MTPEVILDYNETVVISTAEEIVPGAGSIIRRASDTLRIKTIEAAELLAAVSEFLKSRGL